VNIDQVEIYAKDAKDSKARNEDNVAKQLEAKILEYIAGRDFIFPVNDKPLISNGISTFIYKNNKTYPNLLEFFAGKLHVDIPILVGSCKFGPGEILVSAENIEKAHRILKDCTRELQKLLTAKVENVK
jgi:hypothetical protein